MDDPVTWSCSGGDRTRRGLFPRPAHFKLPPSPLLTARGAIQASIVFDSQGRLFVADMSGQIQAFSSSGDFLWSTEIPGGVSATPVVHSSPGQLTVGSHAGWVYSIDITSGRTRWKRQLASKTDPRILSDLLFVPQPAVVVLSSWGGRFVALDAANGQERFSWDAGISPSAAAAARADGTIYCLRAAAKVGVEVVSANSEGKESILYRAGEGKRGAKRTLVAAAPVLDEGQGTAYLAINGDSTATIVALQFGKGEPLWKCDLPHCVQGTPTLRSDGVLVVADLGGTVFGIGSDGAVRFHYASGSEYLLDGPVSNGTGTTYLGDPLGVVHRIDPTGEGARIFQAPRSIQARLSFASDGRLFVPCTDRRVYLFAQGAA